jgi:hypothetical protein
MCEECSPVKEIFGCIIFPFSLPFPVSPETKQHPVSIQTNIPDKANRAVLPCRVIPWQIEETSLAKRGSRGSLQFRVAESAGEGVYEERQKLRFCPTNHPCLPFGVLSLSLSLHE